MPVEKIDSPKVKPSQYYSYHVKRMSYVVVGMLIAVNVAMTILLYTSGFNWQQMVLFIILPAVAFEVFAIMIILKFALEPLEILTRVIARLSRQPTDLVAPSINDPRYVRSGLKELVQTIYDRIQDTSTIEESQSAPESDSPFGKLPIERFPCGVVGLSSSGRVVIHNSKAPLAILADGKKQLKLFFPEDDTLSEWLAHASAQNVTSQKSWRNIPTANAENEPKQFCDVVALYQRTIDSAADSVETILITVDQTETYIEDQSAVDFISVAAHELRGPITVIRGYLDVLAQELKPKLVSNEIELIDRLDVSASRLSGYVNNILNVAKYDRKHLQLHLQEVSFESVYQSVADDLMLRARTQNRLLAVAIPHDLPTVAADINSLSEVFANLVDNAIKYSHEGGSIRITAIVDGDFVKCTIEDHGIGIPSSVASNLFRKFYRSHRSRSSVAGTGLGLFISKVIVESHGGHIGFISKEGAGSTFYFSVPIYSTVANKLLQNDSQNDVIVKSNSGWIRNHSRMGD